MVISIHAPAWGATEKIQKAGGDVEISIHAPAWGATKEVTIKMYCGDNFNPRSRVGSDDS